MKPNYCVLLLLLLLPLSGMVSAQSEMKKLEQSLSSAEGEAYFKLLRQIFEIKVARQNTYYSTTLYFAKDVDYVLHIKPWVEANGTARQKAYFNFMYFQTLCHLGDRNEAISIYNNTILELLDPMDQLVVLIFLKNLYQGIQAYSQYIELNAKIVALREKYDLSKVNHENEYASIAVMYVQLKQYDKAIAQYRLAIGLKREENDLFGESSMLNNIGLMYQRINNKDSAVYYFNEALVKAKQSNKDNNSYKNFFTAVIESNIVKMTISDGDLYTVVPYLEKEIEEALGSNDIAIAIGASNDLANLYLLRNEPSKTLKYLIKAFEFQHKYKADNLYLESLEIQSRYLLMMGKPLESNKLSDKIQFLTDSLDAVQHRQALENATVLYDIHKKERELILKEKQNQLQQLELQQAKLRNIGLSAGLALLALLGLSLYRNNRSKQRLNSKLTATNRSLEQLDSFKKRVTGMIVHDIKNPLNTILGMSNTNPQVNYSGRRILTMVDNMLDIQKLEESRLELDMVSVYSDEVIDEAIAQVSYQAKEKNIVIHKPAIVVPLEVDKTVAMRVLINILNNALKYSPLNSSVYISVVMQDHHAQFYVKDQGEGVSPQHIRTIFEPFMQMESKGMDHVRSHGMGLAFCKLAVEAHGGSIGVEAELEKGATFWFTLPKSTLHETKAMDAKIDTPNRIVFTEEEKGILVPVILQLNACELYEATRIEAILQNIDQDYSPAIAAWYKQLTNAVVQYNEEGFRKILAVV